ncbi:hypothetical protein EI94DRAFT_1744836 [Lactarius quietus]|nr:hypothetical protein EI94DRAFT_1744836 [Lactarius quietus]
MTANRPDSLAPSQVSSSPLAEKCASSSFTAIYPSVYEGGIVDVLFPGDPLCRFMNIVCQDEYWHLSPEVRITLQDLDINLDPARWELSCEEERLRYYLDEGFISVPRFGPPTPTPAFSVTWGVTPTSSDSGSSYLGLGCPIPGPTVDEESTTGICSLCAARLDADTGDCEESEATSEGLGRETPTPSASCRSGNLAQKKRSRTSRRIRRLEKTVESLSHGLILALTEIKDIQGGRTTTADTRDPENSNIVDALSTALSGLSTLVNHPNSTSGVSAPDATLHDSERVDPVTRSAAEPNSVRTENANSLIIKNGRSPVSGLLKPILDFMICPELSRLRKWASAHPGLRSTQLFDLVWVADNIFNVHGGVLIYCLQQSFIPMDAISGTTGSSAWSQDLGASQTGKPGSTTPFFQNLSREYGCLGPIITSSYIEDLSALWAEVHPRFWRLGAQVTRWLEPFVDCGPDYHRVTPLHDVTIALGRHARELFNRRAGNKEPAMYSTMRANNLMRLLCEHRSGDLRNMQQELEFVSRGSETAAVNAEVAALMDRAKNATLTEPRDAQIQDVLAQREVRVMRSYRPRLLRAGTAAARLRSEVFEVLVQTGPGAEAKGGPIGEAEVFWDGISLR